ALERAGPGSQPVAVALGPGGEGGDVVDTRRPGPEDGGVSSGEDVAVVVGHPVPVARRRGGHADEVVFGAADRTLEPGPTEGEDPAVGGVHPVARGARRRR